MHRLINLGFKKVGNWTLSNGSFGHTINIHLAEKNLLYAFVSEKAICYIGKTTNSLRNRMNGYKNAADSQRTNIRVQKEILKFLKASRAVEIYILLDDANLKYGAYNVSLASGLEDNLIAAIKPAWNFRSNIRIKEQELPSPDENMIVETFSHLSKKKESVKISLGQEYWKRGFFNFSKNQLHLLPKNATEVTLFLGRKGNLFTTGRFLFATNEKRRQPRVIGNKALKQWFQKNYKQGETVTVDILEPDLYRIY